MIGLSLSLSLPTNLITIGTINNNNIIIIIIINVIEKQSHPQLPTLNCVNKDTCPQNNVNNNINNRNINNININVKCI